MKKIYLIVLLLLLCGCGPKIERVEINDVTIKLGVDDEQEIQYTTYPEEANSSSIKWQSSDEKVAIVNNGKVHAVGPGMCTISAMVGNEELASFQVENHNHDWDDVISVVHHKEEGHFREWDETVVDTPAWDEVVVDKEAWSEEVVDVDAWDETIVDQEAWNEIVIDQEYKPDTYTTYYKCSRCGDKHCTSNHILRQHYGDNASCLLVSYSNHDGQEEVSHTVYHDAITHVVHHDTTYKTVYHEAETHTVHHPSVTHIVHHDAIYDEKDFSKGNKNYWVIDVAAWDENVVIGYKCKACGQTKENAEGIQYVSKFE